MTAGVVVAVVIFRYLELPSFFVPSHFCSVRPCSSAFRPVRSPVHFPALTRPSPSLCSTSGIPALLSEAFVEGIRAYRGFSRCQSHNCEAKLTVEVSTADPCLP